MKIYFSFPKPTSSLIWISVLQNVIGCFVYIANGFSLEKFNVILVKDVSADIRISLFTAQQPLVTMNDLFG
jgi:hypothetical protein